MHKKLSIVPFAALLAIAILALFMPGTPASYSEVELNGADTAWLLSATALVLFMTPGLAFFYGGMVNNKNVISTMLQSFIAMGVVSILWVFCGFSMAFGESIGGLVGNPFTYFMFAGVLEADPWPAASTVPFVLFALFQLKFAIITPALITGAFAERIRFTSYVLFLCLFCLFIYAPLAHSTWHPDGILLNFGVLDFAGGTVVHISAGCAALAAALYMKRRNNYEHQPANIPYVILGTGLLWFGWFGFNAGSAMGANMLAATAFATTNTASAAACLAWIFFDSVKGKKPSALGACIGAVVGLVAITPAAGFVTIPSALFIGVLASLISNMLVDWRSKTSIDDTLDVFPCHGVGGMVGMVLTGVFATTAINPDGADGLFYGGTDLFYKHLVALVATVIFALFGSLLLLKITDWITPLRVSPANEREGLDKSQHGESM